MLEIHESDLAKRSAAAASGAAGTAGGAGAAAARLPEGWVGHLDPTSNKTYVELACLLLLFLTARPQCTRARRVTLWAAGVTRCHTVSPCVTAARYYHHAATAVTQWDLPAPSPPPLPPLGRR